MNNKQDNVLDDFLKKFISEQEELPPEFRKVIDDHFWELIEDDKKENKNVTNKSSN